MQIIGAHEHLPVKEQALMESRRVDLPLFGAVELKSERARANRMKTGIK